MIPPGTLYGVTGGGGGGGYGYGTVYKLSPSSSGYWNETTLYSFGSFYGDANSPHGKLVFDKAGNLYGTTSGGGTSSGTVFELSPQASGPWLETVVHNFTGGRDGDSPCSSRKSPDPLRCLAIVVVNRRDC